MAHRNRIEIGKILNLTWVSALPLNRYCFGAWLKTFFSTACWSLFLVRSCHVALMAMTEAVESSHDMHRIQRCDERAVPMLRHDAIGNKAPETNRIAG